MHHSCHPLVQPPCIKWNGFVAVGLTKPMLAERGVVLTINT